MAISFH